MFIRESFNSRFGLFLHVLLLIVIYQCEARLCPESSIIKTVNDFNLSYSDALDAIEWSVNDKSMNLHFNVKSLNTNIDEIKVYFSIDDAEIDEAPTLSTDELQDVWEVPFDSEGLKNISQYSATVIFKNNNQTIHYQTTDFNHGLERKIEPIKPYVYVKENIKYNTHFSFKVIAHRQFSFATYMFVTVIHENEMSILKCPLDTTAIEKLSDSPHRVYIQYDSTYTEHNILSNEIRFNSQYNTFQGYYITRKLLEGIELAVSIPKRFPYICLYVSCGNKTVHYALENITKQSSNCEYKDSNWNKSMYIPQTGHVSDRQINLFTVIIDIADNLICQIRGSDLYTKRFAVESPTNYKVLPMKGQNFDFINPFDTDLAIIEWTFEKNSQLVVSMGNLGDICRGRVSVCVERHGYGCIASTLFNESSEIVNKYDLKNQNFPRYKLEINVDIGLSVDTALFGLILDSSADRKITYKISKFILVSQYAGLLKFSLEADPENATAFCVWYYNSRFFYTLNGGGPDFYIKLADPMPSDYIFYASVIDPQGQHGPISESVRFWVNPMFEEAGKPFGLQVTPKKDKAQIRYNISPERPPIYYILTGVPYGSSRKKIICEKVYKAMVKSPDLTFITGPEYDTLMLESACTDSSSNVSITPIEFDSSLPQMVMDIECCSADTDKCTVTVIAEFNKLSSTPISAKCRLLNDKNGSSDTSASNQRSQMTANGKRTIDVFIIVMVVILIVLLILSLCRISMKKYKAGSLFSIFNRGQKTSAPDEDNTLQSQASNDFERFTKRLSAEFEKIKERVSRMTSRDLIRSTERTESSILKKRSTITSYSRSGSKNEDELPNEEPLAENKMDEPKSKAGGLEENKE